MKISKAKLLSIISEELQKLSLVTENDSLPIPKIDLFDPDTITKEWLIAMLHFFDEPTEREAILLRALENQGINYYDATIDPTAFDLLDDRVYEIACELASEDKVWFDDSQIGYVGEVEDDFNLD